MGKRGPKPTPTATLRARGSRRGNERGDDVKPTDGRILCPRWVTGHARNIWHRLAPKLIKSGVLSMFDVDVLGQYCRELAAYIAASEYLDRVGQTYVFKGRDGRQIRPRPEVKIAQAALTNSGRLAACLGLTPADRAGLKIPMPDPEEKDPKEQYFTDAK
jgi:P27 family predicted phage terminase small subunit